MFYNQANSAKYVSTHDNFIFLFIAAPKFLLNLTHNGYFYNDDVLNFVVAENSTCYSCIDCSVTGYPVPNVTWLYHDNSNPYKPVITNESDSTSDLFLLDNGQVCL